MPTSIALIVEWNAIPHKQIKKNNPGNEKRMQGNP
jgi:hypothetical protein